MNCEHCQDLLSEFLDDSLSFADRCEIEIHLQKCADCFTAQEELASILTFCEKTRDDFDAPPNPQALWLRISNLIESENQLSSTANDAKEKRRESFWTRLSTYSWQFSMPQILSGVALVAVVVALLTAVGLRAMSGSQDGEGKNTLTAKSSGSVEDRLRQKQQVIDYWNQRVEARKQQWDRRTREAFERNLQILDETVAQYRDALQQNPQDEIYKEALDSAINEKVELLKEFSEL